MLKNSVVLVTGADGFIGSHLVEALHKTGVKKIIALSQYNSFNNWGWLENVECLKEIQVVTGDVRDPYFALKLTENVDIVFHLAALIAIPYSYTAPDSYIDTNVKGTLNICQGARKNACKRLIHTSTSEVYGSAQYVPIDEQHPLQPQSPYSASKIGADMIALSQYYAFGLPVTVVRPFNTYGPRQSARAVIPNIISQVLAGSASVKLGDTTTTRDFNYVQDTCRGFLQLAECDSAVGETVNIGSGHEISIKDLFSLISEVLGRNAVIEDDIARHRPAKSEVSRLLCDNSKIKKMTGFTPEFTLRQGLCKTVEWFTKPGNLAKYKTGVYNV